jgi:hypothetical protein
MESRAYGPSRPAYGCLGGGRMDEPEYIVTKETEHNGIKVQILRPVATEDEVRIQLKKTTEGFIRAMTE